MNLSINRIQITKLILFWSLSPAKFADYLAVNLYWNYKAMLKTYDC
jgi:hypothetical protein